EVTHDDEWVQLEEDRDAAEDSLEEHGHRQRPRGEQEPAWQPLDAGRADRRSEGHQSDEETGAAIPELDEGVVILRRQERAPTPWPVLAAEARPGQPHGGARHNDEEERRERQGAEEEEGLGRGRADPEPGEPARAGLHHDSTSMPPPSSTRPIRARK